jgi:hypothetical protein
MTQVLSQPVMVEDFPSGVPQPAVPARHRTVQAGGLEGAIGGAGSGPHRSHRVRALVSVGRWALLGIMVVVASVAIARPAHADPDTDFDNELHTYGIYGPKDYNAWIGKLTCKRLYKGLDRDAEMSAKFVFGQLPTGSTTEQGWQFLAAAITTYCPGQAAVLHRAAGQE